MSNSLFDFFILKSFAVTSHPFSYQVHIKQNDWLLSPDPWIKCNTDEVAKGNPGLTGSEGIFIDSKASFKGFFAHHIGIQSALFFVFSEIMAAILAM